VKDCGHTVKGKSVDTWYSASYLNENLIKEALRYSTRCRRIHSFTCTLTRLLANWMNHTCLLWYTGTPFQFLVTDLNRAVARGDGLGRVKCGQLTTFFITAPAAQLKDINVNISGMLRNLGVNVNCRLWRSRIHLQHASITQRRMFSVIVWNMSQYSRRL